MTTTAPDPRDPLYIEDRHISLKAPIGQGREGAVYPIHGHASTAVKLIGPEHPQPVETALKLKQMVNHPPPATVSRHYLITWPSALVTCDGHPHPVGYSMPLLDLSLYRHIGAYFNPSRRRRLLSTRRSGYTYLHLLLMARNLAKAASHLHARNVLIGDLNSRNVLANDRGRIALIDADSFQVTHPDSGQLHRCAVGTPEYTSARLQDTDFASQERTIQDDQFALAVMIYQLLHQGVHPYAGTPLPGLRPPNAPHIAQRIAEGHYSHLKPPQADYGPTPPTAFIWNDLPLKKQFNAVFLHPAGVSAPAWEQTITNVSRRIRQCRRNPLHWHFTRNCTWCRYKTLTLIEPFPAPSEAAEGPRRGTVARKKSPSRPRRKTPR